MSGAYGVGGHWVYSGVACGDSVAGSYSAASCRTLLGTCRVGLQRCGTVQGCSGRTCSLHGGEVRGGGRGRDGGVAGRWGEG